MLQGRWEHLSAQERAIAPGKVFPELETNEELAQRLKEVRVPTLLLYGAQDFVLWYYTPMALRFTRALRPVATRC